MKTKSIILLIAITAAFLLNSCKKKLDQPPLHSPFHKHYSVPELKSIASCTGSCTKRFSEDVFFTGVVIADQVGGNFYKEIYVRDRYNTGAIHIDLKSSAYYFFIGDSIRISLQGYDVGYNSSTGMLEIDSVDFEKDATVFAHGANPEPIDISLQASTYTNYLCDLVRIKNVTFTSKDKNKVWADAIMGSSENRAIKDCSGFGDSILVRTSNYANFAGQKTPSGIGSIVGIATAYGSDIQMAIRTPNEVSMNGITCSSSFYLAKDFNDFSMTTGSWTQTPVVGPTITWATSTFGGATFAKISGYVNPTYFASENWLISPPINLSASTNPVLSFETMANYTGNVLEVKVSTNYTSGDPNLATWATLSGFSLSSTSWILTPSGLISLNGFKTTTTRIAFKYTSTTSAAKTYELDNIIVKEN